jgi:hypothetical protein
LSRFYNIVVTPPIGSSPWTSYPKGVNDPGALNVEFDILSSFYGIPGGEVGSSTITVHGIPLSDLQAAQNFYGANIAISGGMKKGLPLANPQQAGLLLQGMIFQSYANWVREEMNINFVVAPSGNTLGTPGNFSFTWKPGQPLSAAILATLQTVYPKPYIIQINIGSNYATKAPGAANTAKTLGDFAQYIYSLTQQPSGVAVNISLLGNTVLVTDGSVAPTTAQVKNLAFTDLIGQPKWVDINTMQFMTVMRADIQVGSYVKMPPNLLNTPGIVTTLQPAAYQQLNYRTSFQGNFLIQQVRHVGNFRDADGVSWATIFQAVPASV